MGNVAPEQTKKPLISLPFEAKSARLHKILFLGLWRSRLCVLFISLCSSILLLGLVSLWGSKLPLSEASYFTLTMLLCVTALGLLGILFYRIQNHLIAPLTQLRNWTNEMHAGNLSVRLSPEDYPGEFAALSQDINQLAETLQALSEDMQSQVKKQTRYIEQKTRSLEIIYDVAASINISRDLDDLLTRFLHTLKDVVHARAAVVRLMTDDGQMRLVSSIGLDEDLMAREQLIPSESCLCGSAYDEGKVLFRRDIKECDKIVGRAFFGKEDVAMVVVPLQYRDKTLGVYNLFVYREDYVDPDGIKELLTSIGRHLGMAIDKARSDDESNRLSIMEERTRIAHELHDSLAQTLASLRFQVRVLDETLRQGREPAVWHELEKIENNLDEAYAELRELITHFRAPIDHRGLVPAVEHLVDRFQKQTKIHIFLQKEWNLHNLPPSIEVQALRIIQEALNNIRKHSEANTVRILLRSEPSGNCMILIEDDGVGIQSQGGDDSIDHYGMHIMSDRAKQIDGDLRVESEQGEGTQIILRFKHTTSKTNQIEVSPPGKRVI
ncbi:MAG: histidine kinase [Gammaproteobacteria bacterium]|nr:histidine kinase [Gammaproteobacteria bacterium]MDH5777259.1 histidine kinase [Gammaproteobacteria bacterium]